jgi:hypothetical protein
MTHEQIGGGLRSPEMLERLSGGLEDSVAGALLVQGVDMAYGDIMKLCYSNS